MWNLFIKEQCQKLVKIDQIRKNVLIHSDWLWMVPNHIRLLKWIKMDENLKCSSNPKELIRVFYSCLAAQRLKIPAPWGPWPVLFVFIHLVLDLNREQNPYLSKYFIKEFVLNLILQAWWLYKSSWVEIRRVCGYGSIGFREWELCLSTYLLVPSITPW